MPTILRICLLIPFLGLVSCSSEPISQLSEETEASRYYLGKSTTRSDQGEEATENLLIERRVASQEVKVLYYLWTDLDFVVKSHLSLTPTANGSDYSVEGEFYYEHLTGIGKVEGDPFGEWSKMSFKGELSRDPDVKIVSSTTLTASGKLTNNAEIYFQDEQIPFITIDDTLEEKDIADPSFAEVYARVTGVLP